MIILRIVSFSFGQRIKNKLKIKGPAIILSNHSSWFDFAFTLGALYPKRAAFIAAEKMFYLPFLGFFLKASRSIKKKLFDSDVNAMRTMLRHLSQGHCVAISPEGQISFTGHSLDIGSSIASLVKRAGVDVIIVKHEGACLVNPYWAKKRAKGTFETKVTKLLVAEDMFSLSEQEIHSKIKEALFFDPYEYNKDHSHTYKIKSIDGLQRVVYLCQKCNHMGLEINKLSLVCPNCGHTLKINKFGFFDNDKSVYDLVKEQYVYETKLLESNANHFLESSVILESYVNNKVEEIDRGVLTLSDKGYHFKSETREILVPISNVSAIPSDLGENIQIYIDGMFYEFKFDSYYMSSRFMNLGEILYKRLNLDLHGTLMF
jgi:1-acyl-sn-glycerol-3-phosphate acyltransferase/transposase-like protein